MAETEHPLALLRARDEGTRRCPAENANERASPHGTKSGMAARQFPRYCPVQCAGAWTKVAFGSARRPVATFVREEGSVSISSPHKSLHMTRRERWRKVLDIELQRWSAMTPEQLTSASDAERIYEVEFDSNTHQVEVEILENTEEYLHVLVAVDDGTLPASLRPEAQSFICKKKARNI
jgi:hypothetical protein